MKIVNKTLFQSIESWTLSNNSVKVPDVFCPDKNSNWLVSSELNLFMK